MKAVIEDRHVGELLVSMATGRSLREWPLIDLPEVLAALPVAQRLYHGEARQSPEDWFEQHSQEGSDHGR